MITEREDYAGPLQDQIDFSEYSKDFLLSIMRIWSDLYEDLCASFVRIGAEMPGIGAENSMELFSRAIEAVGPKACDRFADVCKVDKKTIAGRIKANAFIPDNMRDKIRNKYPGHYDVINDNEVRLTLNRCYIADIAPVIGIDYLRGNCLFVEPRMAAAYMNYPGQRQVKVDMLKVPEELPMKEGEPCCIWRFKWADEEAATGKPKWSQDCKMKDIINDSAAKAVLDKFIPGLSTAPQLKLAMGMTLKTVCGFAQTGVSKEKLAEIDAALKAL